MDKELYQMKAEKRFFDKVTFKKDSDCWFWKAAIDSTGYGRFQVGKKFDSAHRFAYELFKGHIQSGLHSDHLCRNRQCVNPGHIEIVTPRENVLRGTSPLAFYAKQIFCKRGHILSKENIYVRKDNRRNCIICNKTRKIITNNQEDKPCQGE